VAAYVEQQQQQYVHSHVRSDVSTDHTCQPIVIQQQKTHSSRRLAPAVTAVITGSGSAAVKESVRVTVCSEKKDGTPNVGDHKVMVLQRSAGVSDTVGKAQGKLKMKKKAKVCVY
jgi:hypothetical protein